MQKKGLKIVSIMKNINEIEDNGINLERVYLINQLKAEIRRVNALLRETHNPHEYRQNKKYLERLERKLRQCQRQKKN